MYRRKLLGPIDAVNLGYVSSMEEDRQITREVIEVLIAHVEELKTLHLIPEHVAIKVRNELENLLKDPSRLFEIQAEDVHEAIEIHLRTLMGPEAGYLPLGRSRNDHVAAALRLKVKRALVAQATALLNLREVLVNKARENLETLMIAFTHTQPAQVTTFAHYLTYIDEVISTYLKVMLVVLEVVDKSPLGSGPAVGIMTPINRERIASNLLNGIVYNTLNASGGRDFIMFTMALDTSLLTFLSRIAEDLIIFSAPQLSYVRLPNEHLATSSIMPHKRNPVTLEVARARAAEAIGHLTTSLAITKGLPSGYSLDLQEINKHALKVLQDSLETIRIITDLVMGLEVNSESITRDLKNYPVLTSELAELIAIKSGRPYREVYEEMAELVRNSKNVVELYEGVKAKYRVSLSHEDAVSLRPVKGSTNSESVLTYLNIAEKEIEFYRSKLIQIP